VYDDSLVDIIDLDSCSNRTSSSGGGGLPRVHPPSPPSISLWLEDHKMVMVERVSVNDFCFIVGGCEDCDAWLKGEGISSRHASWHVQSDCMAPFYKDARRAKPYLSRQGIEDAEAMSQMHKPLQSYYVST
jgi:hypothetical protein